MKALFKKSIILLICIFALCGCASEPAETASDELTIISTGPTNTEILIALGAEDMIIAADSYSAELLENDIKVLEFANPDAESIAALTPDIILATDMDMGLEALGDLGVKVEYIHSATSLDDIKQSITYIGEMVGKQDEAKKTVADMDAEIAKIKAIADTITEKKNVYFEISPAPYIYSQGKGTYIDEIITLIGANNVFADMEGYAMLSEEAVVAANPDVIITNADYMDGAVDEICSRAGWDKISAVKNKSVFLVGSNATSRASQNIIDGIYQIAKAVYPEYYE